ncbi:MAG: excinuclease ABC subunit UvrB [Candidatus Schekmanbacteria bacterium]|nr:MAG: excinuclease ABC subunit UvrB [Candidatus Schekmanbacteria bacterium]
MPEQTFKVDSKFFPTGDQPKAIKELANGVLNNIKAQVLLGVTGSGKTYTVAKVIEAVQKPTLVIAHNKTLAAQLYTEFKSFFPNNAVEYFVSYYDYYQPEAYIPQTDTYIEKETSINEDIEKMRHRATRAILERKDVIVVASVSCIYGLGSPETYDAMHFSASVGKRMTREEITEKLVDIQYSRNDIDFKRGTFRVRGDVIDIFPAYEDDGVRIELFGDEVERIYLFDPLTGKKKGMTDFVTIHPNSHYVTFPDRLKSAIESISAELEERVAWFLERGKTLEAQRLKQRTLYDIEMIKEIGFCQGIENYSRHLDGRKPGEPPNTLLEYFKEDFLIIIDESHVTVPQIGGMYRGDYSRKKSLVDFGFRLPSALDNRPLTFEEFEERIKNVIFVSATPGPYELNAAQGRVIEQIVRPTGLIDPEVLVKPARNQVDDLFEEIRKRTAKGEKILVTTLTKRMAEDLTDYYREAGIRVKYLHSEIDTLDRIRIIRDLRMDKFDVLIGINLLREGLDIPEVTLVAILDADKEGFLRSETSLIQTAGRAARNINGQVIMYADTITGSMERAISEMQRRRHIQEEYNKKYSIEPKSIEKEISETVREMCERDYYEIPCEEEVMSREEEDMKKSIPELEELMKNAAEMLDFETAAYYRDLIRKKVS